MSSNQVKYPLIDLTYSSEWDFKDYVSTFGIGMVLIHNVFIRGLNSLWTNAPLVKKEDEVAFAGYAMAWVAFLQHHHDDEEEIIFPFLQSKLDMTTNVDQHAEFLDGLLVFEEYMRKVYEGKMRYMGSKARELLEAFGDALVQHLHDEIPTISPERLSLFNRKEFDEMADAFMANAQSQPVTTTVIMLLTHHDFKNYPSWPPMPGMVSWMLLHTAYWWNHSFWKFAPFDRHWEPQTYIA